MISLVFEFSVINFLLNSYCFNVSLYCCVATGARVRVSLLRVIFSLVFVVSVILLTDTVLMFRCTAV